MRRGRSQRELKRKLLSPIRVSQQGQATTRSYLGLAVGELSSVTICPRSRLSPHQYSHRLCHEVGQSLGPLVPDSWMITPKKREDHSWVSFHSVDYEPAFSSSFYEASL